LFIGQFRPAIHSHTKWGKILTDYYEMSTEPSGVSIPFNSGHCFNIFFAIAFVIMLAAGIFLEILKR
jgi:hypothetical protein